MTMDANQPIWMENESRVIGTVHQPQELFDALREAPVWTVNRTEEERVDELCRVYGDADRAALKAAFVRIREKLGGLKMQEALDALDAGDLDKPSVFCSGRISRGPSFRLSWDSVFCSGRISSSRASIPKGLNPCVPPGRCLSTDVRAT